jgi:hypothetical protein
MYSSGSLRPLGAMGDPPDLLQREAYPMDAAPEVAGKENGFTSSLPGSPSPANGVPSLPLATAARSTASLVERAGCAEPIITAENGSTLSLSLSNEGKDRRQEEGKDYAGSAAPAADERPSKRKRVSARSRKGEAASSPRTASPSASHDSSYRSKGKLAAVV